MFLHGTPPRRRETVVSGTVLTTGFRRPERRSGRTIEVVKHGMCQLRRSNCAQIADVQGTACAILTRRRDIFRSDAKINGAKSETVLPNPIVAGSSTTSLQTTYDAYLAKLQLADPKR
jgi:hypothetical protein